MIRGATRAGRPHGWRLWGCGFSAQSPAPVDTIGKYIIFGVFSMVSGQRSVFLAALLSLGVPLSEVDLILVNDDPVAADHPVSNGDRVSVYPVFESFDITPLVRLRSEPLRRVRFVVDPDLPKNINTITLAYTFFDTDKNAAKTSSENKLALNGFGQL